MLNKIKATDMLHKKLFLVITVLFVISAVNAQTAKTPELKGQLDKIFSLCKSGNYSDLVQLVGIEKDDTHNNDIELPDKNNAKDLNLVKRIGKSINALLTISDGHKYQDVIQENYNNFSTYSLMVDFNSGEQTISKKFRFIDLNGVYYLFKID